LKRIGQVIGVLVLLVAVFYVSRILFPDDAVVIRNLLHEMAEEASFAGEETPLAKVSKAGKLAGYFTVDARIEVKPFGFQQMLITGRTEIREAVIGARTIASSLEITLDRVDIVVAEDRSSASVAMGATVRSSRQAEPWNQVFDVEMKRVEGDWLINRVQNREFITQ
jgi:hypothetical protein